MKKYMYLSALLPVAFLQSYVEIEYHPAYAGIIVIFLLVLIAGTTWQIKKRWLLLLKLFAIMFSVMLEHTFITPPNPSWYNPFSMTNAVIVKEIIFLAITLAMRHFFVRLLKPSNL